MNLAKVKRQSVLLNGIDHLSSRVGEPGAACLAGRPGVEGVNGTLGVVLTEGSTQGGLDQVNNWPTDEEADDDANNQADAAADQAGSEFLQVFANGHGRTGEEIIIVAGGRNSRHGRPEGRAKGELSLATV